MKKNNIPKMQHYVPRFILSHFCEKKNQIWVFDKQKSRKFRTNIKNVAGEGGFYNFEAFGHNFTYEISIAEFEGQASIPIKKIIEKENIKAINEKERILVSRFFSLQFVRTKQWRHMWGNLADTISNSIKQKGWNTDNLKGLNESTKEDIKLFHMESLQKADEYAPHFYDKTWVLFSNVRLGFCIKRFSLFFEKIIFVGSEGVQNSVSVN